MIQDELAEEDCQLEKLRALRASALAEKNRAFANGDIGGLSVDAPKPPVGPGMPVSEALRIEAAALTQWRKRANKAVVRSWVRELLTMLLAFFH